jgi:hypothetical protein
MRALASICPRAGAASLSLFICVRWRLALKAKTKVSGVEIRLNTIEDSEAVKERLQRLGDHRLDGKGGDGKPLAQAGEGDPR